MQRAYDGQTPCEVCGAVAEPGRDLCRGCREKAARADLEKPGEHVKENNYDAVRISEHV